MIDSDELKKDLPPEADSAAPHEIMSAIIGIKEFGNMLEDEESRELFARCITGYKYDKTMPKEEIAPEKDIKNCFIGMLNSKVIDVDRLDYLIRDAYTSGFETVNIDYIRLLKAITIVIENGHYVTAYRKDAVSIIENVVYAHDAERKWIQNHPVVLYETYILSHILENLNEKLDSGGKKLFSEASLSLEGQVLKENRKVSLMCDDDIVYLSKNEFSDELSKEFFNRNSRMHPLWKSEAEYKAYISAQGKEKEISFLDIVTSLCNLEKRHNLEYAIIDDKLIRSIEAELEKAEEAKILNPLMEDLNEKQIKNLKSRLKMCSFLLRQAGKYNWGASLLFIKTTMFNSNFKKEDIKNIPIVFGKEGNTQIKKLEEVCSLLDAKKVERDLCYLFYRRNEGTKSEISVTKFCEDLIRTIE